MFAISDEIPSSPLQAIKEKPKCRELRLQRAITLKEQAPSLYFSTINVHLVDICINVFAKFYEIPLLPFQDVQKPNVADGQRENSIPPQTQFAGGIITGYKLVCLWRQSA